jgi:LRP1 type putative zinc finger protein
MEELLRDNPTLNRAVILWAGCSDTDDICIHCASTAARDTTESAMCLDCYMRLPECSECGNPATGKHQGRMICRSCFNAREYDCPAIVNDRLIMPHPKGHVPLSRELVGNESGMSWQSFGRLLTDKMVENGMLDTFAMRQLKRHRGVDFNA